MGRVLVFSIKTLSGQVWGWSKEGIEPKHVEELNINLSDRRLRLALDLARQLIGTPRATSPNIPAALSSRAIASMIWCRSSRRR